jgi:predicted peroxiredoxin
MSDRLIFVCSHGEEDPERAILAFTAANVAAMAGQSTAVLCTIEGVWLGTKGGAVGVEKEGFTPLSDLYAEYIENGGEVWLCGLCTRPRSITDEQCAEGAKIIGASKVIEEVVEGAKTIVYA